MSGENTPKSYRLKNKTKQKTEEAFVKGNFLQNRFFLHVKLLKGYLLVEFLNDLGSCGNDSKSISQSFGITPRSYCS